MEENNNQNFMQLNGKTSGLKDEYLKINLSDDFAEVRGFGKPITKGLAKEMVTTYIDHYEAALKVFQKIDSDDTDSYSNLKDDNYNLMKSLFTEDKHIVSGVFGKELILQILAQKNCEGIRYIFGKANDKPTIILLGVTQVDDQFRREGDIDVAKSEPIGNLNFRTISPSSSHNPSDPLIGEVHTTSLNIKQLKEEFEVKEHLYTDISDVVFGIY